MKTNFNYATDNKTAKEWHEWMKNYSKNYYELSKEENLALRDILINPDKKYERVAEEFFYHTLSPMNKGLAYQILKTYHATVEERDIATTVYREIYDEGKFTRLYAYHGECSIFTWVAMGAAQIIYDDLENLGIITKSRELTHKNTSLRLKSMTNKDELMEVLDLVKEPLWHDVLIELYVKRSSMDTMMKNFGMNEDTMKKTINLAEITLKEQLIATKYIVWHRTDKSGKKETKSINLVTVALGHVGASVETTTSEEANIVAQNMYSDSDIYDEIKDVLQLKYPGLSPEEMWDTFVKEMATKCGMTDTMLSVWKARYGEHESPETIAIRLDMRRSNIDNLYSRANSLLVGYIRTWWKKHS